MTQAMWGQLEVQSRQLDSPANRTSRRAVRYRYRLQHPDIRYAVQGFVDAPRGEAQLYSEHSKGAVVVKFLLFLVAATIASPAVGQVITDGDTLKIGGTIYRLWGIDAPEAKQTCPDGWPAGSLAATRLKALTAGRSIVCQEKDRDRYGRIVAICRASGEDLGAIMVREGLAWAFVRYSSDYVSQEGRAKQARLGVHAHDCSPAWEWRAQQRVNGRQ